LGGWGCPKTEKTSAYIYFKTIFMNKKTQKAALMLLLLGGMLCQAQENLEVEKTLMTARTQLQKVNKNYNPQAAIASYQQLAAQGNGEAMNALGLIYSKGIGVPVNDALATSWLQKSGEAGYAKGWYNLGILNQMDAPKIAIEYYKKAAQAQLGKGYGAWGRMLMNGEGGDQDYTLARSVFKEGADKDNGYCHYALGYLLYKGFGGTQDYQQAVAEFEIASQKNNPWGMYMLGLCYRNGYGVAIDLVKAKYWLKKSARMGVVPSMQELADPEAENTNPNQNKTISKPIEEVITITQTQVPEVFLKVKQAPIKQNISGNYTGYLLRYDFSGQNLISKTPLEIELQQDGTTLTGLWKETQGDTAPFTAQMQDNTILFKDSKIDRTEHFYKGKLVSYQFKEAQLQLLQSTESLYLVGNLQLYNLKVHEPEKPMYLVLERKQEATSQIVPEVISSVVIHPNPVVADFNLSFTLAKPVADVTMSLYYITGRELYSEHWQNLAEGQQTKTLALNAPAGYYLLRLTYGTEVKTTLLIKQ
jgi:TPR repeat protein